jgi:hypothetical protein
MTSSPGDRMFVLGAGCRKGGTTWLHRNLKNSPPYLRGYLKECHAFDADAVNPMVQLWRVRQDRAALQSRLDRRGAKGSVAGGGG